MPADFIRAGKGKEDAGGDRLKARMKVSGRLLNPSAHHSVPKDGPHSLSDIREMRVTLAEGKILPGQGAGVGTNCLNDF